jgi:hypothetical protein
VVSDCGGGGRVASCDGPPCGLWLTLTCADCDRIRPAAGLVSSLWSSRAGVLWD